MSDRQPPTKVLIVDDHPMMREGLTLRLSRQPDLEVCGEAASEEEALVLVETTAPCLVLVDISLKSGHGIELVKQIKSRHPQVKMLVISGFDESLYAERALRAGAMGYLNKQESNEKLLEAIRTILSGQRFVSEKMAQRLVGRALGDSDQPQTPTDGLTDRELQIFRLVGEGLMTSAIAERLFISTHTVDSHRENIKRKLNIHNAGELTHAAIQWVMENG